jgi:hypothetical protein
LFLTQFIPPFFGHQDGQSWQAQEFLHKEPGVLYGIPFFKPARRPIKKLLSPAYCFENKQVFNQSVLLQQVTEVTDCGFARYRLGKNVDGEKLLERISVVDSIFNTRV